MKLLTFIIKTKLIFVKLSEKLMERHEILKNISLNFENYDSQVFISKFFKFLWMKNHSVNQSRCKRPKWFAHFLLRSFKEIAKIVKNIKICITTIFIFVNLRADVKRKTKKSGMSLQIWTIFCSLRSKNMISIAL